MIRQIIENEIKMYGAIGHPHYMAKFILHKGEEFQPAPYAGTRGIPKQCFCNAMHFALENKVDYVEGYFWRPGMPMLIHHAWNVDEDGRAIDITIDRPEECQYFGVRFAPDVARRMMFKNGYYGLFDGPHGIPIKMFRKMLPEIENL